MNPIASRNELKPITIGENYNDYIETRYMFSTHLYITSSSKMIHGYLPADISSVPRLEQLSESLR